MSKPKTKRNKEIAKRYKPYKMGYKKLAEIYSLDYTTVREIVKRYRGGVVVDKSI